MGDFKEYTTRKLLVVTTTSGKSSYIWPQIEKIKNAQENLGESETESHVIVWWLSLSYWWTFRFMLWTNSNEGFWIYSNFSIIQNQCSGESRISQRVGGENPKGGQPFIWTGGGGHTSKTRKHSSKMRIDRRDKDEQWPSSQQGWAVTE